MFTKFIDKHSIDMDSTTFRNTQQAQLRAQIIVYGYILRDQLPEEALMSLSFADISKGTGELDDFNDAQYLTRSEWDKTWQAASTRIAHVKRSSKSPRTLELLRKMERTAIDNLPISKEGHRRDSFCADITEKFWEKMTSLGGEEAKLLVSSVAHAAVEAAKFDVAAKKEEFDLLDDDEKNTITMVTELPDVIANGIAHSPGGEAFSKLQEAAAAAAAAEDDEEEEEEEEEEEQKIVEEKPTTTKKKVVTPIARRMPSARISQARSMEKKAKALAEFSKGTLVEVVSEDEGLHGVWFSARVLNTKDDEIFVVYDELLAEDGKSQLEEWVSVHSTLTTPPRIRLSHSFDGEEYKGRFCVGDPVDAWMNDGWWEGEIKNISEDNPDMITVFFSGEGDVVVVNLSNLRPSLMWKDGKWSSSHTENRRKEHPRRREANNVKQIQQQNGSARLNGKRKFVDCQQGATTTAKGGKPQTVTKKKKSLNENIKTMSTRNAKRKAVTVEEDDDEEEEEKEKDDDDDDVDDEQQYNEERKIRNGKSQRLKKSVSVAAATTVVRRPTSSSKSRIPIKKTVAVAAATTSKTTATKAVTKSKKKKKKKKKASSRRTY